MTLSSSPKRLANQRIALLAWEATCERLKNALSRQPGVPELTQEELSQTFARARSLLDELERSHGLDDDHSSAQPTP